MLSAASSQEVPAAVIRVAALRCEYAGREALRGVSLEIGPGEFVGILGPNGAGKSTLLLAISGIVPAAEGSIEIMGRPLHEMKPRERARHMAAVTQETDVRFAFSCREVVRMGRYPHQGRWAVDTAVDEQAVERAVRITEIGELCDRLINAVSGGEKQRVIVAKALAQEAQVLLLDEPTSGMDVHRKLQVFRAVEKLNREAGLTVAAVMHDINLAALFCRRLIFLKEGRVVFDGPTADVLTVDNLEDVYQTPVLVHEISGTGKRQVTFLPWTKEEAGLQRVDPMREIAPA